MEPSYSQMETMKAKQAERAEENRESMVYDSIDEMSKADIQDIVNDLVQSSDEFNSCVKRLALLWYRRTLLKYPRANIDTEISQDLINNAMAIGQLFFDLADKWYGPDLVETAATRTPE